MNHAIVSTSGYDNQEQIIDSIINRATQGKNFSQTLQELKRLEKKVEKETTVCLENASKCAVSKNLFFQAQLSATLSGRIKEMTFSREEAIPTLSRVFENQDQIINSIVTRATQGKNVDESLKELKLLQEKIEEKTETCLAKASQCSVDKDLQFLAQLSGTLCGKIKQMTFSIEK